MKTRHTLIIFLILVFQVPSFAEGISAQLNRLEKEMNERPDSVLLELRSISPRSLRGRDEKALYSLLLSQALDKNGIDIQTDSLIAPAVKYYSKRGAPARRMRMNYYRGRIYENAGDPDNAMEWFKKGEEFVGKCSDYSTAGKIYSHKSTLYYNIIDYNDALSNATTASEFFLKAGDTLNYSYRRLDIASIYILIKEPVAADKSLERIPEFFPSLPKSYKARYYCERLRASLLREDKETTRELIESCNKEIESISSNPYLELTLARACLFCEDPENALKVLEEYKSHDSRYVESPNYHLQLSDVFASLENYEGALTEYKTFREISRSLAKKALDADTKFVEEKYESEIKEMHRKEKTNTIVITGLIILATLILLMRNVFKALEIVKSELTESEKRYRELIKEQDALNTVIKHATFVDEATISLLSERRTVIENVLLGYISSDPRMSREAEREIRRLVSDKDSFIISNSRLFAVRYPKLNTYLRDCGLNDIEVGYCSLNMMGLQTRELDKLFGIRTRKSLSVSVREKLDIAKQDKVRLKTFLADKEKEILDSSETKPGENIVQFAQSHK